MRPLIVVSLALAMLGGCGGGGDDACDPSTDPCVIEKDVSTITIAGGVEDEDTCQSWTLNNPTELWVNGISQTNDGAYHHANWFFVPDDQFELPDGTWSCNEQDFSELTAALLGGYLFALSTQSTSESQELSAGDAIRIPPYSRVIGSSHLLNASPSTLDTTMHLRIHTIPPDQVVAKLAPARMTYHDLALDPNAQSAFSVDCPLEPSYTNIFDAPLDYKLHYVLFHYHALGVYAQLELSGGPRDGEVIARHDGYGENFGIALDPPVDLAAAGATGIRFTCGFDNPRGEVVGWGIGDQEMCVVALQAETDLAFESGVVMGNREALGVNPDGEFRYGGNCTIQGFPWDFDKPGGPPR
jgi:hypothetical protein